MKRFWMTAVVVAVSLVAAALGVMRMNGFNGPAFQAVAHLFVGGLIGAGCLARDEDRFFCFGESGLLSVVEVLVFAKVI